MAAAAPLTLADARRDIASLRELLGDRGEAGALCGSERSKGPTGALGAMEQSRSPLPEMDVGGTQIKKVKSHVKVGLQPVELALAQIAGFTSNSHGKLEKTLDFPIEWGRADSLARISHDDRREAASSRARARRCGPSDRRRPHEAAEDRSGRNNAARADLPRPQQIVVRNAG